MDEKAGKRNMILIFFLLTLDTLYGNVCIKHSVPYPNMTQLSSIHSQNTNQLMYADYTTKDMNSLGVRCSSVRCAAKSSVTWLGSPPGSAAQIGQT